jgi:hypothetical protein
MEEIKQLLQGQRTAITATRLQNLYKEITGQQIKTGCFCKSTNIDYVFNIVGEWVKTQENND